MVIAIGAYFYPLAAHPLGQATGPQHYQEEAFLQGLQIGQKGTDIKAVFTGKCSLIAPSFSVVASTSVAMDCVAPGVVKGDTVLAMFASSTASATGPGWELVGASASTTSGFITFNITNGTGVTAIIPNSLASSTQYLVTR